MREKHSIRDSTPSPAILLGILQGRRFDHFQLLTRSTLPGLHRVGGNFSAQHKMQAGISAISVVRSDFDKFYLKLWLLLFVYVDHLAGIKLQRFPRRGHDNTVVEHPLPQTCPNKEVAEPLIPSSDDEISASSPRSTAWRIKYLRLLFQRIPCFFCRGCA